MADGLIVPWRNESEVAVWYCEREARVVLMKIVFYCEEPAEANMGNYLDLGVSGTVSAMLLASHGLAMLGHDVVVMNRSESGVFREVTHVRTESPDDVPGLLREIGHVDVFIANGWAGGIFTTSRIAVPTKVHWIHNFVDQRPVEGSIADGRLDYVVCVSLNQLGTWWRSPCFSRVTNIPNSVDTALFQASNASGSRENKIMFIGATRECKGFHDALRVFRKFHAQHPEYIFYVAGGATLHGSAGPLAANGIFEQEYEQRCLADLLYRQDGSLREEIVLLGRISRKEVLEHLASAKVALVNPSWTSEPETFCISAVDAQAAGVPVVSTFRGGLPEVVEDGKSGILVKGRNDLAMVAAMERLAGDERLAAEFSDYSRAHVVAKFGVPRVAAAWDKRLRHMTTGKPFRGNMFKAIRSKIRHKLKC